MSGWRDEDSPEDGSWRNGNSPENDGFRSGGFREDLRQTLNHIENNAPGTLGLIFVNVILFLWAETHGGSQSTGTLLRMGAVFWPKIMGDGEYWRLLTAAFLHFGLDHIANNMLILALMGHRLERAMGTVRFLVLYLLSAVLSNAASLYLSPAEDLPFTVSAGASGAVFGVIGGLIAVVIRNRGRLEGLSTKQLVFFAGLSLYYSAAGANVDNMAHFSGLVFGFLLAMILYRRGARRDNY